MENEKVLEVDNLHVSFQTYAGEVNLSVVSALN